ncbi:unnamed protein product [Pleuronectes platessa]|uniref:Uncharacterized protein n=1 Tax=Pleuronectes platessa TaxID=8262 RepID=A0A9N7UC01_PLEPL|nr:unnamed protein product [Pleuronectes platessa]
MAAHPFNPRPTLDREGSHSGRDTRPLGSPPSGSAGYREQQNNRDTTVALRCGQLTRNTAESSGEQRGRCGWRLAAKAHQGESGAAGASSSGSGEITQSRTWLRFDGRPVVCICVSGLLAGGNGLRSVTAPRLRSAAGRATGASCV